MGMNPAAVRPARQATLYVASHLRRSTHTHQRKQSRHILTPRTITGVN